jgi:hypothetical protein
VARGYIGSVTALGAATTTICVLAVLSTTPLGIGPLGVTLWFLALTVALSCWFALLAFWLARRFSDHNELGPKGISDSRRRGLFAGGFITILLALSSLRQLSLRDALLLGLLLLLIEFYMVAKR